MAYRLLGSLSDSDDLLQDSWLRWAATPLDEWLIEGGGRLSVGKPSRSAP